MSLPVPPRSFEFAVSLNRSFFARTYYRAVTSELLTVLLIYSLCLQLIPHGLIAATTSTVASTTPIASNKTAHGFTKVAGLTREPADPLPATITDAVVSRHKPSLNIGRIEGSLRVLLGESFTIIGNCQLTSDLYLPGTPTIQLSGNARYGGTVSDEGIATPSNYTVTLGGSIDLPGRIHTRTAPVQLPDDFPASIPLTAATRTVMVHSQSDIAGIGNWQ